MTYEIALAMSSEELEEVVASMINDGFKPEGGLAISPSGQFAQAMVKK